jgi:hypothetical protein
MAKAKADATAPVEPALVEVEYVLGAFNLAVHLSGNEIVNFVDGKAMATEAQAGILKEAALIK